MIYGSCFGYNSPISFHYGGERSARSFRRETPCLPPSLRTHPARMCWLCTKTRAASAHLCPLQAPTSLLLCRALHRGHIRAALPFGTAQPGGTGPQSADAPLTPLPSDAQASCRTSPPPLEILPMYLLSSSSTAVGSLLSLVNFRIATAMMDVATLSSSQIKIIMLMGKYHSCS